jgi:hypothetical protein
MNRFTIDREEGVGGMIAGKVRGLSGRYREQARSHRGFVNDKDPMWERACCEEASRHTEKY